jgi:hypothetical protein
MPIAPEIARRFSEAEKRLKKIESMIGDNSAVSELSDFPGRPEWLPGNVVRSEKEDGRICWVST